MTRIVYVNGRFLPADQAQVSIFDRGFLFADGIYEVTTVIGGRLLDPAGHMARLERSAAAIGLTLAEPIARIAALHEELVARNGLDEGVVYLQATRGAAERDFLPAPDLAPTLVMFTQARPVAETAASRDGIKVVTMPDIRWQRRDIKSVMLLAQVLAKREAAAHGGQEAWMIEDGFVTEGASSTAWIVSPDGRLITRPPSHATLPGCTGAALEPIAIAAGHRIEHRPFTLAEALAAREAFVTAASSLVLPVVAIDGIPIGDGTPGPIARSLRAAYLAAMRAGG